MKPRDINQAKSAELRGSMAAMKRAAQRAREIAIQTNTNLVVVRNGKLVKIPPDELRREAAERRN
jgi:hypothetical protein